MKRSELSGYELFEYASTIIAGGSQLFGKKANLYAPGVWPSYFASAKGCQVQDLAGNTYLDFTMVGTGTSVLGYGNEFVIGAVQSVLNNGNISTLNAIEDVELAELLIDLHPGLDMVRYARSGGEILSVAIRLARAYSKRDKVAICGYHGWHDWYLSANLDQDDNLDDHLLPALVPSGVPASMAGLTLPFKYNCVESLKSLLEIHGDEIGVIILEPYRDDGPSDGFLESVRELANLYNAVLIFDEVTSGFRETLGGMYKKTDIIPDLVTFGKAMSNGIPMSALVGKRDIMSQVDYTFVSSTYWSERTGPAAAIATIHYMKENNTSSKLISVGSQIKDIITRAAANASFEVIINGELTLLTYRLVVPDWPAALTFIIRSMLSRNILSNDRVYANLAHDLQSLQSFERALNEVFHELRKVIQEGTLLDNIQFRVKDMGLSKVST